MKQHGVSQVLKICRVCYTAAAESAWLEGAVVKSPKPEGDHVGRTSCAVLRVLNPWNRRGSGELASYKDKCSIGVGVRRKGKKAPLQDPFQGQYGTFCAAEIDIAS